MLPFCPPPPDVGLAAGTNRAMTLSKGKLARRRMLWLNVKGKQGRAAVSRLQIDGGWGIDLRIRAKG